MHMHPSPGLKVPTDKFRIRHVKCDETKPSCSRCTSTGRLCDFVSPQTEPSSPRPSQAAAKIRKALVRVGEKYVLLPKPTCRPSISYSSHEGNQLEFFRVLCTRPFSGYFDSPFWDKTLLQISSTEPSIRSALVAFATLIRLHTAQGPERSAVVLVKSTSTTWRRYGHSISVSTARNQAGSWLWWVASYSRHLRSFKAMTERQTCTSKPASLYWKNTIGITLKW
jgi:hypothetical protein